MNQIPNQIPPQTWCIASATATDAQLQGFIDFACGGKIDCRFIRPGGDCYEPNTPRGHGSYCLDAYYRIYKDCNQIGTIVYKDPCESLGISPFRYIICYFFFCNGILYINLFSIVGAAYGDCLYI